MKRVWLKICAVLLVVMSVLLATGGEALAWGPITHQKIVEDARDGMASCGVKCLWMDYSGYMYGGAIAPDSCLSYAMAKPSASDASEVASHQGEFHSQEFLKAMKGLADMDEEKAFYYAYQAHVMSDDYEAQLGAAVNPEPSDYPREFYVDKMVVADGYRGETSIKICPDLMVDAYAVAFPNSEWQPTVGKISVLHQANSGYHLWLAISGISVEKGYQYYSSYKTFVNAAIRAIQRAVAPGCKGDFDNDGDIDFDDFCDFAVAYGSALGDANYNEIGDFDGNGVIDFDDFCDFADVYGT